MRKALAVAALIVAGFAAVPDAGAAEKAIWGPTNLPDGRSAFPTYQRLGVDTLQFQLSWRAVAPSRPADPGNPADPAYAWPPELDRAVAGAQAAGIDMALLVNTSPSWANGGRSAIHAPDPTAYATFMAAASRRYPSVRRWMVWGEPNRADRFLPNEPGRPVAARAYAPILDAAYGALKSVSSRNIVIGGMTWTGGDVKPAPFLRHMRLPNGKPPRLDWFGHNPFPIRFPNLRELAIAGGWRDISDLDIFSRQLRRTYGRSAKFWLSEFLVLSDRGSREFELFVSREAQARWLRAAYRIADSLDSVAGLGWLSLLDQPQAPFSSNWGLMTALAAPKPGFGAYARARGERFRPRVRVARGIGRRTLARQGLLLRVRPVAGGRVTAVLTGHGRRLGTVSRLRAGRDGQLRLRGRGLRPGSYSCSIRAPRGSTVRLRVKIR